MTQVARSSRLTRLTQEYLLSLNLRLRWPSPSVRHLYEKLLEEYIGIAGRHFGPGEKKPEAGFSILARPFSKLCDLLVGAHCKAQSLPSDSLHATSQNYLASILHKIPREQLPQTASSALAMLLHCNPRGLQSSGPTNQRRPKCRFSTYPNSPGLSRLMSDLVFDRLQTKALPESCATMQNARRFAGQALRFRVWDPSMEGGQLLLGFAEAWVRRIHQQYPKNNREGRRLLRAGLEKLCTDCLHGTDRNPLALPAVKTVFRLLFDQHGLKSPDFHNLDCQDSLRSQDCTKFDAVINNPPWGERLTAAERGFIKRRFSHGGKNVDTYLAFVEKSVDSLKQGGVYAFALPGMSIATARASGIRELLARQTRMELLTMLPRQVFADAAVRSVVIAGSKQGLQDRRRCLVVVTRNFKDLDATSDLRVSPIDPNRLLSSSWTSLLLTHPRTIANRGTRGLSEIATIRAGQPGLKLRLLRSDHGHTRKECEVVFCSVLPFGHLPAILSRNVQPLTLDNIRFYTRPTGSRPTESGDIASHCSVVLRRLVTSEGRLVAAPLRFRALPVKGVIHVLPHRMDPFLLSSILGSGAVARWIRLNTGTQINPKFQTITISDLRRVPIPIVATQYGTPFRQHDGGKSGGLSICRMIVQKERAPGRSGLNEARRKLIFTEIDKLVDRLYAPQR